MGMNFNLCLSEPNIMKLSVEAIFTLLENKNRTVEEIDIFLFLNLWIKNHPSPMGATTKTALLALVDLKAINQEHLVRFVRGSGLFEDKDICDALEKQLNIEQDQNKEEQLDKIILSKTQKDNRSHDEKEFASKLKKMFIKEPSASLHNKIQWCRSRISVNRAPSI